MSKTGVINADSRVRALRAAGHAVPVARRSEALFAVGVESSE